MNSKRKQSFVERLRRNGKKNLVISVVILIEILMLLTVATFSWVETVSSIKIATRNSNNQEDPLLVDSYVFTEAMIGEGKGTIDLANYFKQAGDMHFAPASSADGETMFFPKVTGTNTAKYEGSPNTTVANSFRKGDSSDKNTAYMSISFKLRADVNADFFFTQVPTITLASYTQGGNYEIGPNIRVSVTAYTEGMSKGDLYDATTGKPKYTKIYANTASSDPVVGNTSGNAVATTVESFANHIKGKGSAAKLFSVAADETKIVTINVWLQYPNIPGYHIPLDIPGDILISNFGIISDLTPRRVTLIPTDRWDLSNTTEYFYAWCWDSSKSGVEDRLYKLELDEYEHYSFQYNGTYQKTLFIRCGNANLTTNDMKSSWSTLGLWNKTEDTAIPNTPVDPTYYIKTISGSSTYDNDISGNKSTGAWVSPDIVTIKTAYVTDQSSTWGTLRSYSYYGTTVTSTQQVEANNSTSSTAQHHDTIHAVPGKKVRLTATANTDYAFVGWYDNAAGTGTALSTSATYDFNASSEAPKEVVYYAKFKEVRKLTIVKYLDDSATNTTTAKDVGTITIGTNTSANDDVTSYSQTYDKGTTVTFSATPSTGYSLTGIYTTATGGNAVTSVTLDDNTTYYARFTTNSYNVTANAYYSTDGGTSYTAGITGGTVKAGSSAAGATSTASVKYKSSVSLTATPASGYEFVGWYSAATGGTQLSTNASYTYTLSTTGAKNVYARFIGETWSLNYGVSGASSWNSKDLTVNGNTISGSMTLTEGQDFSFQIVKTVGSTSTWYGGTSSYENITSTSFISNKTLSVDGGDIYMKGHAGTYTFTFNKSTNVLNVTASYSNITITFDYSSASWWGNDNAVISFYDGSGESNMSNVANQTKKTLSISSARGNSGSVGFNRWNNSSHSTFWNNVDAGSRGYSTTYKVGTGWQ